MNKTIVKSFDGLPFRLQFVPNRAGAIYRCHSCDKTIGDSPFLILYFRLPKDSHREEVFCSKCCRQKIETILSYLQFMNGEVKEVLEYFPVKVKSKPNDIDIGITNNL
ncbi:hypothetical protein LDC_0878 [sediment metagenome]|uniref:Uncharacterized protein n=1 Tax=sediment metagenome TaxID=749907 RepID=D9PH78_9ZZZZ